jgi:hypothetical protein
MQPPGLDASVTIRPMSLAIHSGPHQNNGKYSHPPFDSFSLNYQI